MAGFRMSLILVWSLDCPEICLYAASRCAITRPERRTLRLTRTYEFPRPDVRTAWPDHSSKRQILTPREEVLVCRPLCCLCHGSRVLDAPRHREVTTILRRKLNSPYVQI